MVRGREERVYRITPVPAARLPRIPAPIQWILLAAVLSVPLVRLFEPLENQMFDARLALRRTSPWPKDLVMVPITDAAMKENGRWPWPREKIAELLDALEADGVKTVLLDFIVGAKTTPEADARLAKSLSHSTIAIRGGKWRSGIRR